MFDETTEDSPEGPRPWSDPLVLLAGLVLLALAGGLGFWFGVRTGNAPGEAAPEVGFARDMAIHHAQAVDMATLLRDASDDPEMRQIALDIMLTQQAQIGQMQGWLNAWHLPLVRVGPAMAWMGMPTTDRMPGMAAPSEINRLRALKGLEADGLFLSLMIPHHRAGVNMARAILERSQRPEVRALAESIIAAQESEIEQMQSLLERKGFPLAPDEPQMNHEHMVP